MSVSYSYDCKSQGEGAPSCPQEFCLVADKLTVPAECPQGGTAQNNGSVIAKGVGGTLTLRAIGGPAEVEAE